MCFSSISITEIAIKHMLGRLSLPGPETFPGRSGILVWSSCRSAPITR